jgi:hypothetical protein
MIPVSLVLLSGLESFCLFSSVYGLLKSAGKQAFLLRVDSSTFIAMGAVVRLKKMGAEKWGAEKLRPLTG